MDKARMNVIRFEGDDVIATSGGINYGSYENFSFKLADTTVIDGSPYYGKLAVNIIESDTDQDHSEVQYKGDGTRSLVNTLDYAGNPFQLGQQMRAGWYDFFYNSSEEKRYFLFSDFQQ